MTLNLNSSSVADSSFPPGRSAHSKSPLPRWRIAEDWRPQTNSVIMEERFFLIYISLMIALVAIIDFSGILPGTAPEQPPTMQNGPVDARVFSTSPYMQRFPINDLINRETSTVNDATLEALLELLQHHDLQLIIRITTPTLTLRHGLTIARELRARIPNTETLRELVLIHVQEGARQDISAQLVTVPPHQPAFSTTTPS